MAGYGGNRQHAVLVVNPVAGRSRQGIASLSAIRAEFSRFGTETEILLTTGERDFVCAAVAEAAVRSPLIVACGGDGTVHDVLQDVAGTQATLGVLPMGTANALARNLKLPMDPVAAVRVLLSYRARRIPLGELIAGKTRHYFAVMAGCGPDGALAAAEFNREKASLGRTAYYAHAVRLLLTRRWPEFRVRYRLSSDPARWQSGQAVAVMAARVANLGGAFAHLTRRARLEDSALHVQLLRAPAHLSLPAWFACSRLGLRSRWWDSVDVDELQCEPLSGAVVHAQVDAEPVGGLPIAMRAVPDALSLLMPAGT